MLFSDIGGWAILYCNSQAILSALFSKIKAQQHKTSENQALLNCAQSPTIFSGPSYTDPNRAHFVTFCHE